MTDTKNPSLLPAWGHEKVPRLYLQCIKRNSPGEKASFSKRTQCLAPQVRDAVAAVPSEGTAFLTRGANEKI